MLKLRSSSKLQRLEKIRLMNELKDKIFNTITHNLKTPLNGILLKAESSINNATQQT
jgi:hypothetical protein